MQAERLDGELRIIWGNGDKTMTTYRSARIKSSTKVLLGGDGGVGGNWNVEKLKGADVGVMGDTWT